MDTLKINNKVIDHILIIAMKDNAVVIACSTFHIIFHYKISQTVVSRNNVKRKTVMIESPTKKRCQINLWREQVHLAGAVGM